MGCAANTARDGAKNHNKARRIARDYALSGSIDPVDPAMRIASV